MKTFITLGLGLFILAGCSETTTAPQPQFVNLAMVRVGSSHTCGIRNGRLKCWGLNSDGQLGDNSTTDKKTPVEVYGLPSRVFHTSAGATHSCAVYGGGTKCWGKNNLGQVGDGGTITRQIPVDVSTLTRGSNVIGVNSGTDFSCASIYNPTTAPVGTSLACWGLGTTGQLGDGTGTTSLTPLTVSTSTGSGANFQSYCVGDSHACFIINGGLKCWGLNTSGQLGDFSITNRPSPVTVTGFGPGSDVSAVACGKDHTCAIIQGTLKCWGANGSGQLGDGSTNSSTFPTTVAGWTGGTVVHVSAGNASTCATASDGSAKCWGSNIYGQVGDGTTTDRSVPTTVFAEGTTDIAAAFNGHACAVHNGEIACWGLNTNGQVGNGDTTNKTTPTQVTF